jgi:hypothetical protein
MDVGRICVRTTLGLRSNLVTLCRPATQRPCLHGRGLHVSVVGRKAWLTGLGMGSRCKHTAPAHMGNGGGYVQRLLRHPDLRSYPFVRFPPPFPAWLCSVDEDPWPECARTGMLQAVCRMTRLHKHIYRHKLRHRKSQGRIDNACALPCRDLPSIGAVSSRSRLLHALGPLPQGSEKPVV